MTTMMEWGCEPGGGVCRYFVLPDPGGGPFGLAKRLEWLVTHLRALCEEKATAGMPNPGRHAAGWLVDVVAVEAEEVV